MNLFKKFKSSPEITEILENKWRLEDVKLLHTETEQLRETIRLQELQIQEQLKILEQARRTQEIFEEKERKDRQQFLELKNAAENLASTRFNTPDLVPASAFSYRESKQKLEWRVWECRDFTNRVPLQNMLNAIEAEGFTLESTLMNSRDIAFLVCFKEVD